MTANLIGHETARVLLERRIEESGLTATIFARDVLMRDERTVRNWRRGAHPIPKVVCAWLANPLPRPWPQR